MFESLCGNVRIAVSGLSLLLCRLLLCLPSVYFASRARARVSLSLSLSRSLALFVCLSVARARTCLLSLSDKQIHTWIISFPRARALSALSRGRRANVKGVAGMQTLNPEP